MNNFEINFFKKYIPEGQTIEGVIHQHWIKITGKLFFWLFWWTILPSFIYYYSYRIKELIPFYFLETLLILVFIKIIYDIFDWYNDVFILTNNSLIDLQRSLFKTNTKTVNYDNIEWMEVEQNWIIDKMLKKWDLIIHKIWDDTFSLNDCISPYKAVDKIEEISSIREEIVEDSKFDMVMETLSGVVEDYLERKWLEQDNWKIYKKITNEEVINEVKQEKGTIDLR